MLEDIFRAQQKIIDALGVPMGLRGMREGVLGIVIEGSEALEQINERIKPWKRDKASDIDIDKVDEEVIDSMLYAIEYFICRGLTPEQVRDMYLHKVDVVLKRIETKMREAA